MFCELFSNCSHNQSAYQDCIFVKIETQINPIKQKEMKHAFMIGAFQNPEYLKKLVTSLESESSNIYIHINKRNEREFIDFSEWCKLKNNVHFYCEVKINWGGHSMMQSQLFLMKEALKDPQNEVFHFITGQDMLVRPIEELINYCQQDKRNFIHYEKFPAKGGIDWSRYDYFWTFEFINYRSGLLAKIIVKGLVLAQKLLHIKRKRPDFEYPMYGSSWWSLRRDAVRTIVDYCCNEKNWRIIKYSCAPDEFYYQSILYNSPLRDSMAGFNLTYLEWDGGTGPKILTEKDFDKIKASNLFFARKVIPGKSDKLIEMINIDIIQ